VFSLSLAGDWYQNDLGTYLLEAEQRWFDQTVADIFGFHALQIGMEEADMLRASRIPHRLRMAQDNGDLRALFTDLPFASQSIDLLLLPHVLEFSDHPHQILREVERVLRPEGRFLMSGFNPFSLWGIVRLSRHKGGGYPWHGRFIHLSRIKDWLALLGLEFAAGRMCCYAPPFSNRRWLEHFNFMERAGDRWWAMGGGVYFLHAIKRVRGLRLLAPWQNTSRTKAVLAPATRKSAQLRIVTLENNHDHR
jgi:SAM-dependent methyltransferase